MSDEPDNTQLANAIYVATVVWNIFCAVWIILACIIHTRNHYFDFYTTERRSVLNARKKPPTITTPYKLVSLCTLINLYITLVYILGALYNGLVITSLTECKIGLTISLTYLITKLLVYYVFQLRLHLVYKDSKYAISKRKQIGFAVFLFIYCFVTIIWYIIMGIGNATVATSDDSDDNDDSDDTATDGWYFDTDFDKRIKICSLTPTWYFILYWSVFDTVINIVYVVLFVGPVRKIIKQLKDNKAGVGKNIDQLDPKADKKNARITQRMIALGLKVAIISCVLAMTTIITGIFFGGGVNNMQINIGCIDVSIHATCLLLMTPYYRDDLYYHKLCYLCICCCDRNDYTKRTFENLMTPSRSATGTARHTQKNSQEITVDVAAGATARNYNDKDSAFGSMNVDSKTLDTMSMVRVEAGKHGPNPDNVNESQFADHVHSPGEDGGDGKDKNVE